MCIDSFVWEDFYTMTTVEIVLLLVGISAFILSFILSDKPAEVKDGAGITEDEIKKIVLDEYERTKSKLNEITDETINYSMEKAERKMERISNEKMLALGEYSDNLLNQINSNHQEVVFLHDMLNQNKNDLTNMLGQAIKDADEASSISSQALDIAKQASDDALKAFDKAQNAYDKTALAEDNIISARKAIASVNKDEITSKESFDEISSFDNKSEKKSDITDDKMEDMIRKEIENEESTIDISGYELFEYEIDDSGKKTFKDSVIAGDDDDNFEYENYDDGRIVANDKEVVKKAKENEVKVKNSSPKSVKPVSKKNTKASSKKSVVSSKIASGKKFSGSMAVNFDNNNVTNNNDKILKMHKQGKSNVAIAKELGLGVGEVNLVINLFKI